MPDSSLIFNLKKQLEPAFQPRDFQSMWFALNSKYNALAFTDKLNDVERIAEYKWIVQQFRKYLSMHESDFLDDCSTVDEMIDTANNLLGRAAEYGNDRKAIVYNFIRDDWLMELQGFLMSYKYEQDQNEEEE